MTRTAAWLIGVVLASGRIASGDESVVTVLADFEDNSIGFGITDVSNVLAADCSARFEVNPARGQRSMALTIGATTAGAAVTCELSYQFATPFAQADRVATQAWINDGDAQIAFRVRDARGRVFETESIPLQTTRRWTRIVADLSPTKLRRVVGVAGEVNDGSPLSWPIEVVGYRASTKAARRQMVYLDDLQVEHNVAPHEMIHGRFRLDQPTHLYTPGARVAAQLWIENFSRKQKLVLSVQASWLRADGSEMTSSQASLNLPASGTDFRSRQAVDFSQRVDEPGLYRLLARVRASGWRAPAIFETTIAVTPSNRTLSRGRATFFGVRTNLVREPLDDQTLEIEVARDIGVQLLAIDAPWRLVEPKQGTFDLSIIEPLATAVAKRDMACMLILTDAPEWIPADKVSLESQAGVIEALARSLGPKVRFFQPVPPRAAIDETAVATLEQRLRAIKSTAEIIPAPHSLDQRDAIPPRPPSPERAVGFETTGDPERSRERLAEFAASHGWKWRSHDWWWQRDRPRPDAGALADAVSVLRHYVEAASAGVASVVWFDLRDDTVDPRYPDLMRGLVRRDYSPKSTLLGYANAVGMLGGLSYRGRLDGTPGEFESAVFMSGESQVGVLFPRPNRILPACVAPQRDVEGELTALDFERRPLPHDRAWSLGLVRSLTRPMFLRLSPEQAQTTPQITLGVPWLRLPAKVLVADEGRFSIELDPRPDLGVRYLQLDVPSKAPLKSDFSATEVKTAGGKPVRFDIGLKRTKPGPIPPTTLTVRVGTAGQPLELPIDAAPLFLVPRLVGDGKPAPPTHEVAQLVDPTAGDAQSAITLRGGFDADQLRFAFVLANDVRPGSEVRFGLAAEGADGHAEVRIRNLPADPSLEPADGTAPSQIANWSCTKSSDKAAGAVRVTLDIPAASFSPGALTAGRRFLVAARFSPPADPRGAPATALTFGAGLDGDRSTDGYQWIELVDP